MRHALAVVLALMPVACARPAVAPLPEDPAAALAWVPADVTWIGHQGAGHVAILEYLKATLKDRRPACLDRVTAGVDHGFQLLRFLGDPSGVNAVHGLVDRDAAERCAVEVWRLIAGGETLRVERDGAFTSMKSARGTLMFAWSADGWLYFHGDRGRLQPMLRRGGAPTLAAPLRALLARVSLRDAMWNIFAGDALGIFTGVRSAALVQRTTQLPAGEPLRQLPVTFTFPAVGDAARARDAIGQAGHDEALPEPLRRALATLTPRVVGAELEVDLMPLFMDSNAMQAGVDWIKRVAACRNGDTSACGGHVTGNRH